MSVFNMKSSLGGSLLLIVLAKVVSRARGLAGGFLSYPGELPYQVGLETTAGQFFCGGSLVHQEFVLTAAHCVLDEKNQPKLDRMEVVAGTNDLFVSPPTKVYASVEKIFVPRDYDYSGEWYLKANIAVLKLRTALSIGPGSSLQVLNPPDVDADYTGQTAVVSGFGYDRVLVTRDQGTGHWDRQGNLDGVLRFAATSVLSNSACENLLRRPVPDTLICARIHQSRQGQIDGLCGGDGGGPLVYNHSVIIGVINFSPHKCEERLKPAVYTRVSSYLNFIEDAISNVPNSQIVAYALK